MTRAAAVLLVVALAACGDGATVADDPGTRADGATGSATASGATSRTAAAPSDSAAPSDTEAATTASGGAAPSADASSARPSTDAPSTDRSTAVAPLRSASGAATAAPSAPRSAVAAGQRKPFRFTARRATRKDLTHSWRPGCPVPPRRLRVVRLRHVGFDGHARMGTLVVHRDVVPDVRTVFRRLYKERFPIRRMRPIDVYGGSDDRSLAANNTSAFNCRKAVAAGPASWSNHAYGRAIDINPVQNPYLFGGRVLPPQGSRYRDRSRPRKGMVRSGDVVVRAFASVGWRWGGVWRSPDYQHFDRP